MTQNTSYAVMAQRHEPHDSLDYFPTPPWATRALCHWIEFNVGCLNKLTCWEPAAGGGDMVRPLREYFKHVLASDVAPFGFGQRDFLFPLGAQDQHLRGIDWIITNPPFRLAEQFAQVALDRASAGVALLVRLQFLEGVGRYERLFSQHPPQAILQFTERVPMARGRLRAETVTATAYCWVVWHRQDRDGSTKFHWLPPCRRELERAGDYPQPPRSST